MQAFLRFFLFHFLFLCFFWLDPFVDDSEEVAAVTLELKKRKLRTVHDGFFISSGELEVQKDETIREKKSMVVQNVKERIKDGENKKGIMIPSFLLDDILLQKLVIKKKKKEIDSKIESNALISSSATNNLSDCTIIVPRVRTVKPKPLWIPTIQTLDVLEKFKNDFLSLEIKINKSGLIPLQVYRNSAFVFLLY